MIAIEIREPGEPDVLVPVERPTPVPGAGEVLIRVAAAGVNRPDVFQRRGRYAPPPGASDIPGLEVSGIDRALGPGVTDWRVGDAVCALVTGGGYAEYCVAPAPQCLPVPRGIDLVDRRGDSRNLLHRLDERVRARPAAAGRVAAGPRRLQRHRHDGDSAGAGAAARACSRPPGRRRSARACEQLGAERAINYRDDGFRRRRAAS